MAGSANPSGTMAPKTGVFGPAAAGKGGGSTAPAQYTPTPASPFQPAQVGGPNVFGQSAQGLTNAMNMASRAGLSLIHI